MDIQHKRVILHVIGLLMLITGFCNGQSVTLTGPSVEQGSDTVFTCTSEAPFYYFRWRDISANVYIFDDEYTAYGPGETKYLNFGVTVTGNTSTMTISNTQIEDEGLYRCDTIFGSEEAVLTVQAASFTTEELTTETSEAGSFTTEETTTETPEAGSFSTVGTTTETLEVGSFTTEETTFETPEESSRVPCDCNGLSSGSAVGIAVLAILLVVSIIINVIQFIVWRRQETRSGFKASKKPVPREKRCVSHEANENMAYEMIQTGNSAYTALKLGPSYSPIIAPETVAFFTRLGSIGRGDFGEVWKGELRSNQSQVDVAIRQIPDQVTKSTNILEAVKILSELPDQPNVVTCLGYCQEQGSILYEFISGGTLLTHLQTTGVQSQTTYSNLKPNGVRVDEGSLLNLAWQIAKGMQFLGSKKIIHGTLCAHNVLLADGRQCKISDYGLSSSLFSDKSKPTRWSSPEAMGTGDQSTYGDIWSFGIVLWEIVTLGARPYPNMTFDTVQTEVANGYQMPRPRHCAQEVYTVMSGCWEKEPTNRSNFDQTLTSLETILEK